MFWGRLWGLEQGGGAGGGGQRVSKGVVGIGAGCVLGVGVVAGLVVLKGGEGGRDPERWAWIDVVSRLLYLMLLSSSFFFSLWELCV